MSDRNFEPALSYKLATSTTSANVAVSGIHNQVYLHNDSNGTALVQIGVGAQTAVDDGSTFSLPANTAQTITKNNATNIGCILVAGAGFLRISVGPGS
jgi:hypothetical protein